jgi:leucyl aminopeptidase
MASTKGWTMDQWTVEELKKMGCGAFCAVCQGHEPSSQDRLVRIKYFPKNNVETSSSSFPSFPRTGATATLGSVLGSSSSAQSSARPVVLVGKGVTYDTGGVNLKSANSMKTMKHDMAGSAVALGVFGALASQTCFPHPVELWLAIAENNNGPNAYRPDDVVAAVTGDTIEVVHSDAEGRMLLADVLALASRKVRVPSVHDITDVYSPKIVCDFATLTGTCISSLSNRYIGGFSNRKELASQLIQAGEVSGERCWPFPMDSDFIEDLKSDIADVLQCRQPTEADHIYAASFLQRFVSSAVPWVHFDLSSAFRPGGNIHVNTDYTGSGVRCAVELLTNFISKSANVK